MLIFQHKKDSNKKFNTGTHWLYKDGTVGWIKKDLQVEFDKNVLKIYGGVLNDYYTYEIADDDPQIEKICSGDNYNYILLIDPITSQPTGINVTKKPILDVTLDKTEILSDGLNTVTITVKILDGETGQLISNFSGTFNVPLRLSSGETFKVIKVTITNGQAIVPFKTTKSARYIFDQSDAGPKFILQSPIILDALEP